MIFILKNKYLYKLNYKNSFIYHNKDDLEITKINQFFYTAKK